MEFLEMHHKFADLLVLLILLSQFHSPSVTAAAGDGEVADAPDSSKMTAAGDSTAAQQGGAVPDEKRIVVIDAGSTGTRATLLRFHPNSTSFMGYELTSYLKKKDERSLSSYANAPRRSYEPVVKLMDEISKSLSNDELRDTLVIVRATAGLRLLKSETSTKIIQIVKEALAKSKFLLPNSASSVQTLSGIEEGIYNWASVNYLLGKIANSKKTHPVVECGGGSVQVTYEIENRNDKNVKQVTIGRPVQLSVHSYLGIGSNAIVLNAFVNRTENKTNYQSPCIKKDEVMQYSFNGLVLNITGVEQINSTQYCYNLAKTGIAKFNVQQDPSLGSQEGNEIVGTSDIYYLFKFAHQHVTGVNISFEKVKCSKNSYCKSYRTNLQTLKIFATKQCQSMTWGKYDRYYCMSVSAVATFFLDSLNLAPATKLTAIGSHDLIGWPLGLGIKLIKDEPNINSANTKDGYGAAVMASFIAVTTALAFNFNW